MLSGMGDAKSILVAEDDDNARRILVALLSKAGYAVRDAADGRQALEALRQGPPPDLILLDLAMPVLDGWEFLREQKKDPTLAAIPVVVVSGTHDPGQQADALGVEALFRKPVEFSHLLGAVHGLVRRGPTGILVIDDDPSVRMLLEMALTHQGLTVWSAPDGREGVELYQKHRDGVGLVLLDVQMPGMDGPETLAALRGIDPAVRCCFMTGNPGQYDLESLLSAGADRVFAKPFGLAEFTRALRQMLGTPPG